MKLIKQINSVFNDGQMNIGTTPINNSTKAKQKLNKSYENLLASNKQTFKG